MAQRVDYVESFIERYYAIFYTLYFSIEGEYTMD
jgi:hypothetical protein